MENKEVEIFDICPMCGGSGLVTENNLICPTCFTWDGKIVYGDLNGMMYNHVPYALVKQTDRKTSENLILEITSYLGMSFGAQHYYGELHGGHFSIELRHNVSEAEAIEVNKNMRREYDDETYNLYKVSPGSVNRGFLSENEIIEYAKQVAKIIFPCAKSIEIQNHVSDMEKLIISLEE